MFNDEHGETAALEGADQIGELGDLGGSESRGWLVQQNQNSGSAARAVAIVSLFFSKTEITPACRSNVPP